MILVAVGVGGGKSAADLLQRLTATGRLVAQIVRLTLRPDAGINRPRAGECRPRALPGLAGFGEGNEARTPSLTHQQCPDWRPFLDHYLPVHQAADAAFAERLHGYLTIFPLFWLALLLNAGLRKAQTGALPGWEINEMPANERLRRYLARALAWPEADFDSHLASLPTSRFFP